MKQTKFRQTKYSRDAHQWVEVLLRKIEKNRTLRGRAPKTPRRSWSIDLDFFSLSKMKALHHQHLGKNRPTDVLSFPAEKVFFKQGFIGTLAVCTPVMKAQAKEYGHSVLIELKTLVTHGVLHLLGFDHEQSERARSQMAKFEEALMSGQKSRKKLKGLIARTK